MVQVSDLAKHILNRDPQKKAERLALYHFLKNCRSLDESLTPDTIDQFFRRALSFPHWQANRDLLWAETQDTLGSFHSEFGLPFHPNQVRPLHDYELVEIHGVTNLLPVLEKHVAPLMCEADQSRVVWDGVNRAVSVQLTSHREVNLRIFDRWTYVQAGGLMPLRNDQALHYGSDLELKWNIQQSIDVAPFTTARFIIERGRATGFFIKGYIFQKADAFETVPVDQIPRLFFPIKRLESLFINREKDPYYREVVMLLEHATELLQSNDPEAFQLGTMAFEKGQTALELVFVGDRVLSLLLKDLARTLDSNRSAPTPQV